ncbi:MAG: molybdenum cofactor biosynthesis protein MoaE, partial [Acidithiobacillus sp.]
MLVKVQAADFDPQAEMDAFPQESIRGAGGLVSFVGTVRDYSDAADILAMEIEHYPGMTERELERISAEARAHYDILDSLIIHRFGRLAPNERIVQVTVWARHRAAAFDACRFLI